MNKRLNNSLYMWRYYTIGKEKYNLCLKATFAENINVLPFYYKAYALLVGCLSAATAIFMHTDFEPLISSYRDHDAYFCVMLVMTGVTVIFAIFFSYLLNRYKKHGKHISNAQVYILLILFYIFVLVSGTYSSVWSSPDSPAIVFLLLIVCCNFLIIASPLFNMSLALISSVVFLVFSRQASPMDIWIVNILNVTLAASIGVVITWFVNMRRMQGWVNAYELVHERQLLTEQYAKEKDFYFTQCQLMHESVEAVKSVRHDMKAHLFALKTYLTDNKVAMTYLDGLVEDINESEIYSKTGNMVVDSVINYKLKSASENSIKLCVKTTIPQILNIEAVDMVTILGNLLDNALEATAVVEEKRIDINISYNKSALIIKIDNTFDGIVNYTNGDSANGAKEVIATRKSCNNHGYGLKNIRKAVDKYDGHMEINHDENVFSVGVMLYVEEISA